ncbi:8171_t:CDS:1 [Ambispora gerdemannii]|uniref:8171_t:CDS:1 n=1 Tax=Ambispora gerdemannii TaxID=144530 RepID=A0A9N9HBX0_9GLOM|nr:8171_t:CDS:1 [Ambispora gerdemannii]
MAYINTLPIRVRNSLKIPIAVENEGFFYRHHPVTFSLVASNTRNSKKSYRASGRIFLTDKRLIFIADKPSNDGFETFSLIFTYVSTSMLAPIAIRNSFAVTLALNSSNSNNAIETLKLTITFDSKDMKAKQTMADYYSMIMESTSAVNKKKSEIAPDTLESITALNANGIGEPPSYRRETRANEVSFGYNHDNNHHGSVGVAVGRGDDSHPPPPYSSTV